MKTPVIALVLAVSLLGPFSARPAAANGVEPGERFDAIVVASEAELAALLDSGQASEYEILSAAELGLDEAALADLGGLTVTALLAPSIAGPDVEALLPPSAVGFDAPERPFVPIVATSPLVPALAATARPAIVPAVALRPGRAPVVVPAVTLRTVVRPVLVGRAVTPFGRVLVIRRF